MTHNGMRNFVLSNLALFSLYFGAASALAVPYFQYPVQVTAYGAKCDGMTDDTAAIQAAVVAAQTVNGGGGTVQFPSGVCVIDLLQGGTGGDSSITLSNVALVGAEVAHNSTSSTITPPGTTISIGSSSTAPYGGMTGTSGTFVPFFYLNKVSPFAGLILYIPVSKTRRFQHRYPIHHYSQTMEATKLAIYFLTMFTLLLLMLFGIKRPPPLRMGTSVSLAPMYTG